MSKTKKSKTDVLAEQIRKRIQQAKKTARNHLKYEKPDEFEDVRKRLNRLRTLLSEEVLFECARLLGSTGYIRKVSCGDEDTRHSEWQVGTFEETGKYKILCQATKPERALARALILSQAEIPKNFFA
jgi:hypothetical protein